jgi:RNA polymerase sigma-70 factor (ECF subfamily)
MTEVSRELGIPRGTLYERKAKIRNVFEKTGLRDYLE